MVDPVDYHLLLKYPDRDEPENSDFTSFTGEITRVTFSRYPRRASGESRRSERRTTSRIQSWSAFRSSRRGRRADS
jgi:hypothetical protein